MGSLLGVHRWMNPKSPSSSVVGPGDEGQACQGPTTGSKATVGQEDVADGVAMAALPLCVVIACSNGTERRQNVERKKALRR